MKREDFVKSWDASLPDEQTGERMLSAALEKARTARAPGRSMRPVLTLAACVAALSVLVGVVCLIASRRAKPTYAVELPDGGKIVFEPAGEGEGSEQIGSASSASLAWNGPVVSRAMTAEEFARFLPVSAGEDEDYDMLATFDKATGALIHVEGRLGITKACFSLPGYAATDAVAIPENEPVSVEETEDGVQMRTGYFVTDKNSGGKRFIIFTATLSTTRGEVYLEAACSEDYGQDAAQSVSNEVAYMAQTIAVFGGPDFGAVTY